ncbi:hypothetical protein DCS_04736 [Drechmeria coniospora]|uniref:Uncharacterized protein n=1 Tax=Drechmeria coniospora TaxID=98403 RepID=A0A151GKS7_DRECN|nr:hypothetical protein DCS_04736 [Drechmeria coniospora]KYK57723.1 hypothetical protein DCS_04736 [Drechmeria coniospora]ODA79613.1 hypothetical protein RJ55_05207 [Drechmeria coniospora]
MQFLAIVIASLASIAAANPTPNSPPSSCKPGTYECAVNSKTGQPGWNVCNTSSQWVYGGDCPPHTICKFNPVNQSPYCVPPSFMTE